MGERDGESGKRPRRQQMLLVEPTLPLWFREQPLATFKVRRIRTHFAGIGNQDQMQGQTMGIGQGHFGERLDQRRAMGRRTSQGWLCRSENQGSR